jgi:hypothetical protein
MAQEDGTESSVRGRIDDEKISEFEPSERDMWEL